ncbi:MAG: hypothetical protein ACR2G6_10680, partial [Gemmatimonadaceae bacterium]
MTYTASGEAPATGAAGASSRLHTVECVEEAASAVRSRSSTAHEVGLLLGTGLGGLAGEIEEAAVIEYGDIPNF